MQILVTNDDGILAEGLWILVRELKKMARVTVVAPDREQSAIGSAVTLRQPLRIQKIKPVVPGVEAYSVEGTPSDSVILALGKLVRSPVDMVISGINQGYNLGEDVHISGTVGGALQGYLRGVNSLAISAPPENGPSRDVAARVAAILAQKIGDTPLPTKIFLNVNMPERPLAEITGVKISRLARESHINTVEEGSRGRQKYYWLVRQRMGQATNSDTDIGAVEQGYISITPLYTDHAHKPPGHILHRLGADLIQELQGIA